MKIVNLGRPLLPSNVDVLGIEEQICIAVFTLIIEEGIIV